MQRFDFQLIASWIAPGSRVLDLGCGDGVLLAGLAATHGIAGYGVEIDDANVLASVKNGVNVVQRDLEEGLAIFEDNAFDFVILSHTLQAMRNVELIMRGHMPVSKSLSYSWWDTPNIHLCTVKDFEDLCVKVGAEILDERVLHEGHTRSFLPNLLGSLGVFRFRRRP